MGKEDLKITLDELNAIVPIFAHEFCDKNVGENDKVIIGAAAYMEDLKYEKVLYWMPMIELPEEAMQDA